MAVITISREVGSGGDEIARRVCELLSYSYFDKTLMMQIATQQGISDAEVIDFSEDQYRLRGFLDALLRRSAPVATTSTWTARASGEAKVESSLDEETASRFAATIIRGLCDRGQTVVVGRGGQAILHGQAGTLHVRIVAGREDRVPRIMESERTSRGTAQDRMNERDRATAEYLKRFYNVDWNDPLLYHMVLNTSMLGVEGAAQMIAAAVRQMESEPAMTGAVA